MTLKQQEEALQLLKRVKRWEKPSVNGRHAEDAADILPDVLPILEKLIKEASKRVTA